MLETEINILVDEFVFNHGYNPVEHIKSRIKSEKSIKNKLKDKGYDYTPSNIKKYIHDVVGIRIVVSFLSDVYDIVTVLKNSQDLIIVKQQDYIIEYKFNNADKIPLEVYDKMYENSLIIKELDKKMMHLNEVVNKYENKDKK